MAWHKFKKIFLLLKSVNNDAILEIGVIIVSILKHNNILIWLLDFNNVTPSGILFCSRS